MNTRISRVQRTKAEARASYNQMSRWYDLLAGGAERKYREVGLELLAVVAGELVLEIGYGTGHCILALAQAVGDGGKVYGVDLSDSMHAIARRRIEQAGLAARVELRIGDAAEMEFDSDSLHAVFTSFTLELFDTPEIPIILQKCQRALRPGGRICVVSLAKPEHDNLVVRIYEWFHERAPRYVDCRPIPVRSYLGAAGFELDTVIKMYMWGLPVEIVLAYKPEPRSLQSDSPIGNEEIG